MKDRHYRGRHTCRDLREHPAGARGPAWEGSQIQGLISSGPWQTLESPIPSVDLCSKAL